jgi:uncharacterized membrane protein YjjB (DUF3815 family)
VNWSILLGPVLLGVAGSFGFAIAFNLPARMLLAASMVGGLGLLVKGVATQLSQPPEVATFLGALTVGILAEIGARGLKTPRSLLTVPGFIPLVPGVPAFKAVVSFADGLYITGLDYTIQAALLTGAIAGGLATVRAFSQLRKDWLFP